MKNKDLEQLKERLLEEMERNNKELSKIEKVEIPDVLMYLQKEVSCLAKFNKDLVDVLMKNS